MHEVILCSMIAMTKAFNVVSGTCRNSGTSLLQFCSYSFVCALALVCVMVQKKGVGEAGENTGKMRAGTFTSGLGIRLDSCSAL